MANVFKSKEFRIGLFTIIIIAGLYFLINFFKGKDFFRGTRTFYALYENVNGLTASSPVSILGLKAGSVDQISYLQDRKLMLVRMRIAKSYGIPRGSCAEIYSADILGSKSIRILLTDETEMHRSGDTLSPRTGTDLMAQIMPLKDQLSGLMNKLDTTLLSVNRIIDTTNRRHLTAGLDHLETTLAHLQNLSATLAKNRPALEHILQNADSLVAAFNSPDGNLNQTMKNLEAVFGQLKDANLQAAVQELHGLLAQLQNQDGSLGKLMHRDDLYEQVRNLVQTVDSLVAKIAQNPKKYFRISVF